MTSVTFNKQDGLITVVPNGKINPSTLKAISSAPGFANGVLDPPDQSEPGRGAFSLRCVCFHRAVGDRAVFSISMQSTSGEEIPANDVEFVVAEEGQGPTDPEAATSAIAVGSAVNKTE